MEDSNNEAMYQEPMVLNLYQGKEDYYAWKEERAKDLGKFEGDCEDWKKASELENKNAADFFKRPYK